MSSDEIAFFVKGEKKAVYGQVLGEGSKFQISDITTPKCSLLDSNDTPIAGFDNIDVSGYEQGMEPAPRVWYILDSSSLDYGTYYISFIISGVGDDENDRILMPPIMVQVVSRTTVTSS